MTECESGVQCGRSHDVQQGVAGQMMYSRVWQAWNNSLQVPACKPERAVHKRMW